MTPISNVQGVLLFLSLKKRMKITPQEVKEDGVAGLVAHTVVATNPKEDISHNQVAATGEATVVDTPAEAKEATTSMTMVVMVAVVKAVTGEVTPVREAARADMAEAEASLPVTLGPTRALLKSTLLQAPLSILRLATQLLRLTRASNLVTEATRVPLAPLPTRFSLTT